MKKKLLALAVGAALASPMLVQADVKISGAANLSLDYLDTFADWNSTINTKKVWNVSSNSSNFKISGDTDLGSGLKGVFLIQEFVRMDHLAGLNSSSGFNNTYYAANQKNTNRLFDGEAYGGLTGGFGTALLGSLDTFAKKNGRAFDLFGNQIGDSRNLDVNNNRVQNSVAYLSPEFFGVQIGAAHATNLDNNGDGNDVGFWSTSGPGSYVKATTIGVTYKGGPVVVGAAMDMVTNSSTDPARAPLDDEKWYNVGASFSMIGIKVAGLYQKHENVGLLAPTAANAVDKTTYGLGVGYTFLEKNTVKAQFYHVKDDATNTPARSGDADLLAVGYDYAFSKAFTGYVAYAKVSNSSGTANIQAYSEAGGGHGDNPRVFGGNNDMSGMSVGFSYVF